MKYSLHYYKINSRRLFRGCASLLIFTTGFILSTSFINSSGKMTSYIPNPDGDTIKFSDYYWVVKNSYDKHTGPGRNYFSGSKDNVWVDMDGKLHLRITYRNDRWYCAEVRLTKSLGYGRYNFYIDKFSQPLDKDLVVGLFIYDKEDTDNYYKEIDIEFSKWGSDTARNTQYVIQPYEDRAHRFNSDLNSNMRQVIDVKKGRIHFESFYLSGTGPDIQQEKYFSCKVRPNKSYQTGDEKVSLNLWIYKASEPSNLKEFEVVISRFEFKPNRLEKFKPNYPLFSKPDR